MIKVFIVDDHAVVRAGLRAILPAEDDIEVVGDIGRGTEAAAAIAAAKPDVVLLDIRMPDKDGLDVLSELKALVPEAKVIMLTTSEADNDVYEAVKRGAKGYVVKDRDAEDVYAAIRRVAEGGVFMPSIVQKLYAERDAMTELSERELTILDYVSKGLSNPEIADILTISRDTVKDYMKRLYMKLGVNDRVSATIEGYRRGFLRISK